MNNSVTISQDQYQELLRKAADYDALEAQFKAVSKERDQLKASLEQSQARYTEVAEASKKLAEAVDAALAKNEELDNDNKNLRERVTKLNDMLYGNKGNVGKKQRMAFELMNQPNLFSEFEDDEINKAVNNLNDRAQEAIKERNEVEEKARAEKEAQRQAKRGTKKTAQEREAEREKRLKGLKVVEDILYPEGYDPEKHMLIGKETMDVLRHKAAETYIQRIVRLAFMLRPEFLSQASVVPADNSSVEGTEPTMTPQNLGDEDNSLTTTILKAPMPVLPFKKAHVGADFIAWMIIMKFMLSMPEYRIIRKLKLDGILWLSTSTLNDWFRQAAEKLYPLYLQQWKFVLKSDYVQGDEVPYNIADQDGKVRKGSSFQVFDASERRGGTVFVFDGGSRTKKVAEKIFMDYEGAAQFDDYAGYHWLRTKDKVTVLSCLAHALRKFRDCIKLHDENRAIPFYNGIQAMYAIDRTLKEAEAGFDTIKAVRMEKTLPIFDSLVDAAQKVVTKVRPKSSFARALNYFINNAEGIRNVFKDGRYHWDNNSIERRNRTTTIGRKNYLFAKNNDTGENLAIFYTFTETLMELDINAQQYFEHIFSLPLDSMNADELKNQLPYFYAKRLKEE